MPDGLTSSQLAGCLANVEAVCQPITEARFAGALNYLVAHGLTIAPKQPDMPDPIALYYAAMREYPASVIARAIKRTVATHKWNTPVLVAELIEHAEQDGEWARLKRARSQLASAKWKAEMLERDERARQARELRRRGEPVLTVVPKAAAKTIPIEEPLTQAQWMAKREQALEACHLAGIDVSEWKAYEGVKEGA